MAIRNTRYVIVGRLSGNILDSWFSWSAEEAKKEFNERWKYHTNNKSEINLVKMQIIQV